MNYGIDCCRFAHGLTRYLHYFVGGRDREADGFPRFGGRR